MKPNEQRKQGFKHSDDNPKLPDNFKVEQSIAGGDCFFDSVAKGLKQLKPEVVFTAKALREVCKRFALCQLENDQSWLKVALRNEAEHINVYVQCIEFTADDIEQKPDSVRVTSTICGRSEIEGRIISNEYNVKIHVIEKTLVEGKLLWRHQIVDSEGSRIVDSIDNSDKNTVYIIKSGNSHFEPILINNDELTSEEKLINIIKSSDSKEEKLQKIEVLFERQPELNINFQENKNGDTPLHFAVYKKELEVIKWLRKKGAKINIRNRKGKTSLDIAKCFKEKDIVQIFEPQIQPMKEGKQGLHGETYQLKLLMLFLKRGVDNQYSFRLGTEIEEAKKFDDLVFEITREGKKEYRLLQAKHKSKKHESKKITFDDLLTESDGDYSLVKYFFSYQDTKKQGLFKEGFIKDVTLCTNSNLDLGHKYELGAISKTIREVVQEIEEKDNILYIDSGTIAKEAVRYRFNDSIALLLKPKLEDYNLTRLAKRLAECFFKNDTIQHLDEQDIFKPYHGVLAKEVINVKDKKFHDEFIKNGDLSENTVKFSKVFAEEVKKKSKMKITLEGINLAISDERKVPGLTLSEGFGDDENKNWPIAIPDEDVKDFLDHLVFAVNQPNEEELGKIIENDISKEFNFNAKDYVYYELLVKMLDWLNGKGNNFISHEDGNTFFDEAKQKLSALELTGLTNEYRSKIGKIGVEFKLTVIEDMGLNNFITVQETKAVFNLETQQSILSATKVYQALKTIYNSDENYIFLQLDSVLRLQDCVIQAFKGSSNLLVIECNSSEKEEDVQTLYDQLSNIIHSRSDKKVVLISQVNNILANIFKFALKIKYQGKEDEFNGLSDLTDASQEKLLEERLVAFQGKEIRLSELVRNDSKHLIDGYVLSKIARNERIEIDKPPNSLGEIKYYYIDRIFNRRVEIKSECFKEKNIKDLFVVSNIGITELSKLTDEERVLQFKSIDRNDQSPTRFIILDDDENVEENLKQLYKDYHQYNIHWLKKEDDKFLWQESQGVLSNLRKFVDASSINEYQADEITDISGRVVVVSAEPGMGKSTLLTALVEKVKESDPSLWIVRINLNDHTEYLKKTSLSRNKDDAIDILSNIMDLKTPLERELLKHRINTEEGKIALLFDGFDEISPTYTEKVLELLNILKDTKIERLWVTTRPYMKDELEDKLSVLSYTLKALSRDDQKQFLKNFWSKNLDISLNTDDSQLNIYVEKLLNVWSNSIADKEVEFTGIPLQTRMLAEAFQDNFKMFYDSDQDEPNLPEKVDLVNLYERFVDKKFNIYSEEKKKEDQSNVGVEVDNTVLCKTFIQNHQKAALYRLFEKDDLVNLLSNKECKEVNEFITKVKNGKEKTGIISQVINENLNFIHRTFAEYFAACWFADNHDKKKVRKILISKMFKGENGVLRNFFDRILSKDEHGESRYEIHNAVLNGNKRNVQELLSVTLKAIDNLDNGGRTALHLASAYGYDDIAQLLLNYGADIAIYDEVFDWSPLKYADKGNYWHIAELLLQKGANGEEMFEDKSRINNVDGTSRETLLHLAAQKGFTKLAEVLVNKGADINAQNKDGKTPLHCAAENSHSANVILLVNKKALININSSIGPPYRRRPTGWTPLHYAVFNNHTDVVKFLFLDKKAELIKDSNGSTPLDIAEREDIIKVLGGKEYHFKKPAINNDDLDSFKKLTENVVYSAERGWSSLHCAAAAGSPKIVDFLVRNGAKIDGEVGGTTPLAAAAAEGNLEIVKYLVNNGANINTPGTDGWTALHAAARATCSYEASKKNVSESHYLEIVKYFIADCGKEKGVDIDVSDRKGTTPLQTAATHNKFDIVRYLVEKGANINAIDKLGATIVLSASFNNNSKIVEYLIRKDAMIDSERSLLGELRITVLHFAAMYNNIELIKLLVEEKKVDVNSGDNISLTPLHFAALSDNQKSIDYLINHGANVNSAANLSRITNIIEKNKKALEGSSMYTLIEKVNIFFKCLPMKTISTAIGLTPNIVLKLFDNESKVLEDKSKGGKATSIRIWCFKKFEKYYSEQVSMLKEFIRTRKANKIEPLPQDFVLHLPDRFQQTNAE